MIKTINNVIKSVISTQPQKTTKVLLELQRKHDPFNLHKSFKEDANIRKLDI